MTPLPVSIAAAVASFVLLVVVFELIRSRRLRERYALLWLLTGVVLLGLSIWRDGLNTIAGWFGVETYPPAILGRDRGALHPRRAAALLDRDLATLRPEHDPRAAARAARTAAEGRRRRSGHRHRDRRADDVDIAEGRVVHPVGGDTDSVRPAPGAGSIRERGCPPRGHLLHVQHAVIGGVSKPPGAGRTAACALGAQHAIEERRRTARTRLPPEVDDVPLGARRELDRCRRPARGYLRIERPIDRCRGAAGWLRSRRAAAPRRSARRRLTRCSACAR